MKFESARPTSAVDFGWIPSDILHALPFLAVLALIAVAGGVHLRNRRKPAQRKTGDRKPLGSIFAGRHPRPAQQGKPDTEPVGHQADLRDPKNQLDAIGKVSFETSRLLNKEESRLLPVLETAVQAANSGLRVMAQTSMGEILRPKATTGTRAQRAAAFASINSKRLDFAIFDRFGKLLCAVEYQGSGHYQGTAYMRDAVKREVLRRAGVPLLEVPARFDNAEVTSALLRILDPASEHRHTAVHV